MPFQHRRLSYDAAVHMPSMLVEDEVTDDDIQGPFYIADAPVRTELDLYGDEGTSLTISGRVLDADCEPLPLAVVEVWHAELMLLILRLWWGHPRPIRRSERWRDRSPELRLSQPNTTT